MTKEIVAQNEELTPEQLSAKKLAEEKKQQDDAQKRVEYFRALTPAKKEAIFRTQKLWLEIKLLEANLAQIHHQSGVPFIFGSNQGLIPEGIEFIMRPQPTAEQVAQAKEQAEAQAQSKAQADALIEEVKL